MPQPPLTPRKLRPFVPLVSPYNRQKSLSPPPDLDSGVNSTPIPASSGMFLLVRNVLPDKAGFGNPVDIVKKVLAEIVCVEQWKSLDDITLTVIPGGRPQDPHCSSVYLELDPEIRLLDPTPRPDFLSDWMNALSKYRPNWEVVWAPQKKGKDKCMTVRFRVAETKDKVPVNASDKIRAYLETKGHRTIGGYISFNRLVDIQLADTCSVDPILASSYFIIPTLSKAGMHVSSPRFIPINNLFELCISGLNDYDGIHETIEKWLYYKYVNDDEAKSARVYDTRVSSDRDHFIFAMDSWESTLIVLKDVEAFSAYFAKKPHLTEPKLLYEMNSLGFARKSTTTAINAGAAVVNDAIIDLKRDLAEFRKDQTENNSLVQRQVASIHVNMENQTNAVATIGLQLQQFGLSLLAGRDEKIIEGKISAIDNNIIFESQCLRTAEGERDKAVIKANISALQNDRRELTISLAKASETTVRLIGPAPGTVISAPPPTNSSQPPFSPSNPVTPSAITTPNLPSPFIFGTPSPTGKRDKPHQTGLLETSAAKRHKLTQRQQLATNTAYNPLSAQIAQADELERDLLNDEADCTMVRFYSCLTSSSLFTACADQDQCLVIGSRPLNLGSMSRSRVPTITDQRGRARIAEYDSSRKTFCHSHTKNFIPPIVAWALFALFFLCNVVIVNAIPAASGSLSFYALNTNGFVHPTKIDSTNRAISHRNPDIVVITETKTNSSPSSKMSYNDYQLFEERGTPASGHHLYKWGVILGVKKGITVAQRVPVTHPALVGRLVAVDIVIPLDNGLGFTHRVIAAYAPWNIADNSETAAFWTEAAKICLNSTNSWTLLGDLNATITQNERKSGGSDARIHFNNFLRLTKGYDLWSNYPDRSRLTDWTCKPRLCNDGGSIIDRIVTSSDSFLDSEIFVADGYLDFVPMTDHRAVIGRLILKPPGANSATCMPDLPTPVLNNPRIKFPNYKDKHLFQVYREDTDRKIEHAGLHNCVVTDDVSFITLYTELTNIINESASEVFGRITRRKRDVRKTVTNLIIQKLQAQSRAIGGAIRLVIDPSYSASHTVIRTHALLSLEYSLNASAHASLRCFLNATRKIVNKKLYKERSNEIYARAKKHDFSRISQALAGGSTKRLVHAAEFVPLPLSINTIDGSGKLLTSPEQLKAETRRYWEKLYARQPIPPMDKPWLLTKSVKEVHQRVSSNPFIWPRKASLLDFRALIRRGNARPSPGPDGMEKWCVKSLSDFSLTPILELHNYMTMNSCFPGDTKDMYLTMFHKRGLRTDLNNWRGLMISNFIANSPMTWLNYLLTPFIAANHILPDTQVATQQGVQTRDLTSFLAGVLTWANRHKTTVYALKRDQMKGFDYLAPEGFYDAISAYGLPDTIIDIDKAAQTNTKVFIRTAHGLTEPIFVSGVAKQGGPISPLKSTLTTSLGHRYLDDVASDTPGALTITTSSHDRLDPHLPDDHISLPIRMIEATDDSIIFARSISALQTFCLLEERFQYAYGWFTNWLKTTAYVLSPSGTQPGVVSMPSITVKPGVSPLTVTVHDVPLIQNEIEFLRVKIDNPSHRFLELKDFIDAFTFPKFVGPTPITLIRKIVMQSIASRARALLTFQPITEADALKLDRLIAAKVHTISGFPWVFNSEIATLPVSLHGFDFPSIHRINASIAVDGLARDLNHHIPAYCNMARITLADWTCSINDCVNPLAGIGIHKDFSRRLQYHTIPAAWIIAQKHMGYLKSPLHLCSTDLSHILNGDVSISHFLKLLKTHGIQPSNGVAAYSLRAAGLKSVNQLGYWSSVNHSFKFIPHDIDQLELPPTTKLTNAVRRNWTEITQMLSHSDINWFFHGSFDLLIPRSQRRDDAENYITALARTCQFKPSTCAHANTTWASDGSMIPAASSISDSKSITAAVTGPATLVLRVVHRNTSILQGEQLGLLAALTLAESSPLIYTDHLNSTMLIDDS